MSLVFTTAQELVDIKIQRNNTLIEILELEACILKKVILINYRWVEHNKEKIELIKEINKIEEQQKKIYCPIRQEEVLGLTNKVNFVNIDVKGLNEQVTELKKKCKILLNKLHELNMKIPNQTVVTNYKIPLNNQYDCHGNKLN